MTPSAADFWRVERYGVDASSREKVPGQVMISCILGSIYDDLEGNQAHIFHHKLVSKTPRNLVELSGRDPVSVHNVKELTVRAKKETAWLWGLVLKNTVWFIGL